MDKEITFPVTIGPGDIEVSVSVTPKEFRVLKESVKLIEAIDNGENDEDDYPDFADVEGLEGLRERIIEVALDEAANSAYDASLPGFEDKEYDFNEIREYIKDNFVIGTDFPDEEELE